MSAMVLQLFMQSPMRLLTLFAAVCTSTRAFHCVFISSCCTPAADSFAHYHHVDNLIASWAYSQRHRHIALLGVHLLLKLLHQAAAFSFHDGQAPKYLPVYSWQQGHSLGQLYVIVVPLSAHPNPEKNVIVVKHTGRKKLLCQLLCYENGAGQRVCCQEQTLVRIIGSV